VLSKRRLFILVLVSNVLLCQAGISKTCKADDVASLNKCLNQASDHDLVIELHGAKIDLTGTITISNAGHTLTIKDGALSGDLTFTILNITAGSNVKLDKVTIEEGYATGGSGGGIYNLGHLELCQTTVASNKADESGGAIYNGTTGHLTMDRSIIADSRAFDLSGGDGGGGGIFNLGIIHAITHSTITGNVTSGFGAGINNQATIKKIFDSTISHNKDCITIKGSGECGPGKNPTGAGGGIFNESNSEIEKIINSTIADNFALQGAGIFNNGTFTSISNTTIGRNIANLGGGGIYNNTGGTIVDLVSTIVAENKDTNSPAIASPDINNLGTIVAESYNLVGNNQGVPQIVNGQNNDIVGRDAHILELRDNGGFTYTMALDPRSPAINNGLNPYELEFDQRAFPYPRVVLGRPDIGAYEFEACRDSDLDLICDEFDVCPFVFNPDQDEEACEIVIIEEYIEVPVDIPVPAPVPIVPVSPFGPPPPVVADPGVGYPVGPVAEMPVVVPEVVETAVPEIVTTIKPARDRNAENMDKMSDAPQPVEIPEEVVYEEPAPPSSGCSMVGDTSSSSGLILMVLWLLKLASLRRRYSSRRRA